MYKQLSCLERLCISSLYFYLFSNEDYDKFLLEMEESFVKLKIAEKEERIRKEKERRNSKPSANNKMTSQQKDGKYFLVRLDMEIQRIKGLIDVAERESRVSHIPDEGI